MAPRATWKGYLRLGEVVCAVALHTAISTNDRVSLHMLNRRTGHRLQRRFIDPETGETVERDDQVKGFEISSGEYVVLEPEEVAAVIPESDKTLGVESFIPCGQVDDLYFDRPYYLRPADSVSEATYSVIREGLSRKKVAAIATGVLFRRERTMLIRAYEHGLIGTLLSFDYEVRSAEDAFTDVAEVKIEGEMLDLARHIIKTKAGAFEPETFRDRYEDALVELVRAKIEGRPMKAPKEPAKGEVVDLMDALRRSAGMSGEEGNTAPSSKGSKRKPSTAKAATGDTSEKSARKSASKAKATSGRAAPTRKAS